MERQVSEMFIIENGIIVYLPSSIRCKSPVPVILEKKITTPEEIVIDVNVDQSVP